MSQENVERDESWEKMCDSIENEQCRFCGSFHVDDSILPEIGYVCESCRESVTVLHEIISILEKTLTAYKNLSLNTIANLSKAAQLLGEMDSDQKK